MTKISIDFNKVCGKIKPMNGVGQPPFYGKDFSYVNFLKQANIPYSRLHDVGGPFGRNLFVDIPNIFRDFSADPNSPDSYDFSFTDLLIASLIENNVEPVFRLGVSIENYVSVKAYRVFPPEDFKKWATVCEHIIKHYNEGWANGYEYNIKYWEIWNEPDNFEEIDQNQMWQGTKEQYFELYDIAAKHLKAKFPELKIGGYGSCGFYAIADSYISSANSSPRYEYFITFFDEFLKYIKEHSSPLDFFSWHSYDSIENNRKYAEYARKRLDQAGYKETETTCNEWNCMPNERGTMLHAANNTAMLIMMQGTSLDNAMFYDAGIQLNTYGGLFHPLKRIPYPLYYGFKAFGKLLRLSAQVEGICDNENVYVLSACDQNSGGVLVVNVGEETDVEFGFKGKALKACRKVDLESNLDYCDLPTVLEKNSIYYIEAI